MKSQSIPISSLESLDVQPGIYGSTSYIYELNRPCCYFFLGDRSNRKSKLSGKIQVVWLRERQRRRHITKITLSKSSLVNKYDFVHLPKMWTNIIYLQPIICRFCREQIIYSNNQSRSFKSVMYGSVFSETFRGKLNSFSKKFR